MWCLFTVSSLRNGCIFAVVYYAFNKATFVTRMWNSVHIIICILDGAWGVVPLLFTLLLLGLKLGLHLNANRMWTLHAKMKRMFHVHVLLRRGKQHSAVRQMFSGQPNTIHQLSRYFEGNSHSVRLCGSIRCLSECQTVFKCSICSASPCFYLHRLHLHSDVNPT